MKFLIFRAIIVFSFGLIALQLFNIQINSGDLYSRLAEKNRFRLSLRCRGSAPRART